jgi:hypothetical protein
LVGLSNLAGELAAGRDSDAVWTQALDRLVMRLARTVPAALRVDDIGEELDMDRVREACRLELEALEPTDREERAAAADRAARQLDTHHQLFGVRVQVIAGNNAQGEAG